jgi:hypothetical protein
MQMPKTWLLLPLLLNGACRPDCEAGQERVRDWCLGSRITPSSGGESGTVATETGSGAVGRGGSEGLDASSGAGAMGGSGASGMGGSGAPADADAPDCGTDAIASGMGCLPRELFVDWFVGHDDNPGTFTQPFKSFRRAMQAAQSGQIVNFNTGNYGAPTDDDFGEPIPDGVTLRKLPNAGVVTFEAALPTSSLIFAGGGGLNGIRVHGFHDPIKATTGQQFLANVDVYESTGTIILAGDAEVHCDLCYFSGNPLRGPLVTLEGSAKLYWNIGSIYNSRTDCAEDAGAEVPHGITLHESASLFATRLSIWGKFGAGIFHDGSGAIELAQSDIREGCKGWSLITDFPASEKQWERLAFEGTEFYGSVTVAARGVRARNSWFLGLQGLALAGRRDGIDDLGNELEPGGNKFTHVGPFGVVVTKQEVGLSLLSAAGAVDGGSAPVDVIQARGNTWVPSVQGADRDGTYPENYVIRAHEGRNVWAKYSEVRVGRVAPAQPRKP